MALLPKEQVFSKYNGVWNLSAEQGNLGVFYLTNVRVVWFAQLSENFNVSLPWVQVKCVKLRESKYGLALVLETSEFSGGYVLGFKVDQLEAVFAEVLNLFRTYSQNPVFGVDVAFEDADAGAVALPSAEDDVEIVDAGYSGGCLPPNKNTYSVADGKPGANIVFSQELGLAVEAPPTGVSLEQLWKII